MNKITFYQYIIFMNVGYSMINFDDGLSVLTDGVLSGFEFPELHLVLCILYLLIN